MNRPCTFCDTQGPELDSFYAATLEAHRAGHEFLRECERSVSRILTRLLRNPRGEATPFAWPVMWLRGWER